MFGLGLKLDQHPAQWHVLLLRDEYLSFNAALPNLAIQT
jgi:hypothetical protein